MRAHPWLIGVITLLIGLLLWWAIDSNRYDRELERDATYERMASV